MPMYALRLGWTTGDVDSQTINKGTHSWTQPQFMNNAKHFVQSDADLLLATIKPLAFTTKDVPVSITPKVQMTLDEAEKIYNRMLASVNSIVSRLVANYKGFNKGGSETEYSLKDLMISVITDDKNLNRYDNAVAITATTPALTPGQLYYDVQANKYWYCIAAGNNEDLTRFWAEYIGITETEINRAIQLVDESLSYATYNLYQSKIADKVLNYSTKLDKWLGENFNHALQPTLFAIHGVKKGTKILQTIDTTNAKLNRVSGVKGAPLAVTAGEPVILKATSYTVETFCPIMRKFVTISEVDGKAISASEAEALSYEGNYVAKLGHVSGSYIDQYAFAPEKGKTYTILYEAVDYFGNTFKKEYYIKGE